MVAQTIVVICLLFVIGCSLAQVQCDSATDKWTLYHSGGQPTSDPVALLSVDGVNSKVEVTNAALQVSGVDLLNAIQALQSQVAQQNQDFQALQNEVQALQNEVQSLNDQVTDLKAENLNLESKLNETIHELEVVQNNSTVIKTGLQNTIRSVRTMGTTYFSYGTVVCNVFPATGSTLTPVTDYIYSTHNITLERESVVSCRATGTIISNGANYLMGGIALSTENNLYTNPENPGTLYGSGLGIPFTRTSVGVPFATERDFVLTAGSHVLQLRFKAQVVSQSACADRISFACRVVEVPEPVA